MPSVATNLLTAVKGLIDQAQISGVTSRPIYDVELDMSSIKIATTHYVDFTLGEEIYEGVTRSGPATRLITVQVGVRTRVTAPTNTQIDPHMMAVEAVQAALIGAHPTWVGGSARYRSVRTVLLDTEALYQAIALSVIAVTYQVGG